MRTFVAIVMLSLPLLAAEAVAFAPASDAADSRAAVTQGQPPGLSLTAHCANDAIPAGVTTIVDCAFEVVNGTDSAVPRAILQFQPSEKASTPDEYYFFRLRVDGLDAPGPYSPLALSHVELGEMPAHVHRVVDAEILFRASVRFEFDALVAAHEGADVLARSVTTFDVFPATPSDVLLLVDGPYTPGGMRCQPFSYFVGINNPGNLLIDDMVIEVAPGYKLAAEDNLWAPAGVPGHFRTNTGHVEAGTTLGTLLRLTSAAGVCLNGEAGFVAHLETRGGGMIAIAAIASGPPKQLVVVGSGPRDPSSHWALAPIMLAIAGCVLVRAGLAARRRARTAG